MLQQYLPFTVLKHIAMEDVRNAKIELQQYLPFTVLKPCLRYNPLGFHILHKLQQYLPFTVLKPSSCKISGIRATALVATVLTVYGIETLY